MISTTLFRQKHGAEYVALSQTVLWKDLIDLIDSKSPARTMATTKDGDLLAGGAVFASKIAGHEGVRKLLTEELFSEPPKKASPDDYSANPIPIEPEHGS